MVSMSMSFTCHIKSNHLKNINITNGIEWGLFIWYQNCDQDGAKFFIICSPLQKILFQRNQYYLIYFDCCPFYQLHPPVLSLVCQVQSHLGCSGYILTISASFLCEFHYSSLISLYLIYRMSEKDIFEIP